ncbi:MAG: OmpA family protein [Myxococcota bacterium]
MQVLAIMAMVVSGQIEVPPEKPAEPASTMLQAGLFAGLFLPAKDHELYDSLAVDHRSLSVLNPAVGLRLGFFPAKFIGAEVEGGYAPSVTEDDDLAHIFAFRAHALVMYPARFTPFAVVGGGLLASAGGALGDDVDQAFHWGLGAKYYFNDRWIARLDGRHIYTGGRGFQEGNTSHFEVLAGLSFVLYRSVPSRPWADTEVTEEVVPSSASASRASTPEPAAKEMVISTSTSAAEVRQALEEVHFAFGSADLRPASYQALDRAAVVLRQNPHLHVRIEGHTDHVGSEAFNLQLSEARALAVSRYLASRGIAADRLHVFAMGESSPVAPNDSPYGRALNRRSEFTIEEPADRAKTEADQKE